MGRKFIVEEVEEKKDGGSLIGCGCSILILLFIVFYLRACLGCEG